MNVLVQLLTRVFIFAVGIAMTGLIASLVSAGIDDDATSCLPAQQQHALKDALAAVASSDATNRDRTATSQSLISAGLVCFPSSGSHWTALAMITLAAEGPGPTFQNAFNRSELTSPSQAGDMKQRLRILMALRDSYPELLLPALDRYLRKALHEDITRLLATLPADQRAIVLERMRMVNTPQIRRWFQGNTDQTTEGR